MRARDGTTRVLGSGNFTSVEGVEAAGYALGVVATSEKNRRRGELTGRRARRLDGRRRGAHAVWFRQTALEEEATRRGTHRQRELGGYVRDGGGAA
jgi:hypothetical protein